MKAKEDKQLEKLVDHMMKGSILDTPSGDFTFKVMSQVLATKTSNITTYKPLISKKLMIIIFSVVFILIGYSLFLDNTPSNNHIPHFDFIPFNNPIKSFQFSKITTYSVVLTAIMLFIQIPFLKNYYDSKFDR